jgi:hypothetical protein
MKYNKFKKIVKKVHANFPSLLFSHHTNDNDVRIIKIGDALISVLHDSTWEEIKKNIEKVQTKDYKNNNCNICENIIRRNVRCTKCACNMCSNCYINIFKINKGIIICPFCRFTYGQKMEPLEVQCGVIEIKRKLGY